LIESVASNVPRLDYTNGSCPSILVEPQRTNSLLNSATVANQTITTGAVQYTLSFYGTGTITLSGTHTATVVGTGTTRKTYTFTPTAGNLILTVSGTCTRGQLEAGSYATSEIPTTSSIVTRNADVISKTGISSLIGQTEGVIFLDFFYNGESKDFVPINLFDSAGSNHLSIYIEPTKLMYFNWSSSSGGILYPTALTKGRYKVAGGYINNNFVMYVNGNLIGADNTGIVPTCNMINLSNFGNSGISLKEQVEINTVALWKTRLTNSQLQTLTTP
jgi:hypothetical protein